MISDSEAGVTQETVGSVVAEDDECGDDVVGLLTRDRRRLVSEERSKAVLNDYNIHIRRKGVPISHPLIWHYKPD